MAVSASEPEHVESRAAAVIPKASFDARFGCWFGWPTAVALLAVYWVLAYTAVLQKSPTYDESVHLTGGYTIWKYSDYRLNVDNGNLPKRWAALPLLLDGYEYPSMDQEPWRTSDQWEIGRQFFFDVGNNARRMIAQGRAMMGLLTCFIGALIYGVSRRLFGRVGGVVSLLTFVFSPLVLGHGVLVTSDMTAAGAFLLCILAFWRALHRLTPGTATLSVLSTGLLAVAKFSAPLIAPMMILLAIVRVAAGRPVVLGWRGRRGSLRGRLGLAGLSVGLIAAQLIGVWLMVWASYGFRYSMFQPEDRDDSYLWLVEEREIKSGLLIDALTYMNEHRMLPQSYAEGFMSVLNEKSDRPSFMRGEFSTRGWYGFFPFAASVKTPVPTMMLAGLAIAAVIASRRRCGRSIRKWSRGLWRGFYRTAPLWILLTVYLAVAINSRFNLGLRHLLPAYLPMFVLIGGVGYWFAARRRAMWAVTAGGLMLLAAEAVWTWPNYIAYFNFLAGGSSNGHRLLVDSSLDWGQDLPALRKWIDEFRAASPENRERPIYVSYFGTADPEFYGVDATLLPCYSAKPVPDVSDPLTGGVYCISASLLQGVYLNPPGLWNRDNEERYRAAEQVWQIWKAAEKQPRARAQWQQMIRDNGQKPLDDMLDWFNRLRLARLCSYLRSRPPDGQIEHSILVYFLGDREVENALHGELRELSSRAR